jgi:arabinogalactan oligomer/maltooligosaccharide transport system substrate-binding protein
MARRAALALRALAVGALLVLGVGASIAAAAEPPVTPEIKLSDGKVAIHYHRPDGKYEGWGLHTWGVAEDGVVRPLPGVTWATPLEPNGRDDFGVYWVVPAKSYGDGRVSYIIHDDTSKDCAEDSAFSYPKVREVWVVSGTCAPFVSRQKAVAAAPLASPERVANLVVWTYHRAPESAAFGKLVAAYNARKGAAGPHVTVVPQGFDGFADKVTVTVPRGKGPDVFLYPQDRLGGWIEAGNTVESIDRMVDQATRNRFIPAAMQAMLYRGAAYGLPFSFKLITLIYNKKLVSQPPRTTAALAALAKKLTRGPDRPGLIYEYADYYFHAALQNGLGGRVFDDQNQPVLDSPENVRAMEILLKWKADFLPDQAPSLPQVLAAFNEGKAAMIIGGPWLLGDISPSVDYALAQLPAISEANDRPMRPWMTVEGMYLAATCKQKEAAYDFMKYMTETEAAKVMALEGNQMPANQRVYADPQVVANPRVGVYYNQVRVAVAMPNLAEMTLMWSPAASAIGNILRGSEPPQVALGKAQLRLKQEIAERNSRRQQAMMR